jgi:hypothetical protein
VLNSSSPSAGISGNKSTTRTRRSQINTVTRCATSVLLSLNFHDSGTSADVEIKICKYPDKAKRRKATLSSEEFVSTQVPRLEKEAEPEDDDSYTAVKPPIPARDRRSGSEPTVWKRKLREDGDNDQSPGTAEGSASNRIGSTKAVLQLERLRQPLNDAGNAAKRARVGPPILGSGLVSSHLKGTFKAPFKTPFKTSMDGARQSTGIIDTFKPRSPVSGKDSVEALSDNAVEDLTVVSDEEAEMVESAPVGVIRHCEINVPDSAIFSFNRSL